MNSNTKKTLEAVLVSGVLVVSLSNAQNAFGLTVCVSGTAGPIVGGATSFVKTSFSPKCSANTYVDITDSTASFGVKGYSIKGNQVYGGTTEGGGVSMCSIFSSSPGAVTATSATGC